VFGWEWETAWLSSATLLARYRFARDLGAAREGRQNVLVPKKFINLKLTDPDAILDAVLGALGIEDQLTAEERDYLLDYLTDGGATTTLDLKNDEDAVAEKLHGLVALALQAPAAHLN
jgi:hypothetical protein